MNLCAPLRVHSPASQFRCWFQPCWLSTTRFGVCWFLHTRTVTRSQSPATGTQLDEET